MRIVVSWRENLLVVTGKTNGDWKMVAELKQKYERG